MFVYVVKITNSFVSADARNNGNCNLIGCYDCIVTNNVHALILIISNNPIIIFLYGLIEAE